MSYFILVNLTFPWYIALFENTAVIKTVAAKTKSIFQKEIDICRLLFELGYQIWDLSVAIDTVLFGSTSSATLQHRYDTRIRKNLIKLDEKSNELYGHLERCLEDDDFRLDQIKLGQTIEDLEFFNTTASDKVKQVFDLFFSNSTDAKSAEQLRRKICTRIEEISEADLPHDFDYQALTLETQKKVDELADISKFDKLLIEVLASAFSFSNSFPEKFRIIFRFSLLSLFDNQLQLKSIPKYILDACSISDADETQSSFERQQDVTLVSLLQQIQQHWKRFQAFSMADNMPTNIGDDLWSSFHSQLLNRQPGVDMDPGKLGVCVDFERKIIARPEITDAIVPVTNKNDLAILFTLTYDTFARHNAMDWEPLSKEVTVLRNLKEPMSKGAIATAVSETRKFLKRECSQLKIEIPLGRYELVDFSGSFDAS